MTFQEARAKLAQISGGTYRALYYELVEQSDGSCTPSCRVYVGNDKNATRGFGTWDEAFNFHAALQTQEPLPPTADVAEMPEGVTK